MLQSVIEHEHKLLDRQDTLLESMQTNYAPSRVIEETEKFLTTPHNRDIPTTIDSPLYKAATLGEFDNGILLVEVVSEQYRTFSIDMCRQLQQEYNCHSISEKATCELATISYIRTLETQRLINEILERRQKNRTDLLYLAILSKELDRANRHFSSAIQTLRMMKQPQLQVTVKAQTAIIGQNQVVQANNSHE